ncbi:MAG: radical SAM protein [Spirochaetaceae bacterium]
MEMTSIGINTHIDRVYIERSVASSKAALRAIEHVGGSVPVTLVSTRSEIPQDECNHRTLFIAQTPTGAFKRCPGSRGHLCCNYLTVDLYAGCTLGCTYCIMKSYLASSPVTVYADLKGTIVEIRRVALENPNLVIRVGTGEVGDSLLYDQLFQLSEELISGLADLSNVRLELKTKSTEVNHLLQIPEKGGAVIGFSLNPESVAEEEEPFAPSLNARIDAALRASDAGYGIAFHFDPIIMVEGWKERYDAVVESLSSFRGRDLPWVSLGTLRFTKRLRAMMEERPYLYDEFFPSKDGKLRYFQRSRVGVYRHLRFRLREVLGEVPIYLCMESAAVWQRSMGMLPQTAGEPVRELFRWPSGMPKVKR